ncbi:MAG: YfcE family phosphodiesterase [Pseudomonadales bacterium]|nr:YfcE family phosphodiesterase [Pseudomonadales bacterium]
MKIGIVSDTHNNLKNCRTIVDLFNDSGVERVIHTGDITQAKTVEVFAGLHAPLWGVFGNNDQGELAALLEATGDLGFEFLQPPLPLEWSGRRIVVVHDPLELNNVQTSDFDVILHGHTHRLTIEYSATGLTFNPGECAGMMKGFNAVGILDLETLTTELMKF